MFRVRHGPSFFIGANPFPAGHELAFGNWNRQAAYRAMADSWPKDRLVTSTTALHYDYGGQEAEAEAESATRLQAAARGRQVRTEQ